MAYTLCQKVRDLTPYRSVSGDCPIRLDANESCFDLNRPDSFPSEIRPVRIKSPSKSKKI